MVRVVFEQAVEAQAAAGARLLDVCDEVDAPVAFSCRDASCATCLVEVTEGAALLDAPRLPELRLLARVGAPPGDRLACQARVLADDGLIVLRARKPDDGLAL